ncbi:Protein translocase subunit SecD [Dirofilaria immitis]
MVLGSLEPTLIAVVSSDMSPVINNKQIIAKGFIRPFSINREHLYWKYSKFIRENNKTRYKITDEEGGEHEQHLYILKSVDLDALIHDENQKKK